MISLHKLVGIWYVANIAVALILLFILMFFPGFNIILGPLILFAIMIMNGGFAAMALIQLLELSGINLFFNKLVTFEHEVFDPKKHDKHDIHKENFGNLNTQSEYSNQATGHLVLGITLTFIFLVLCSKNYMNKKN